MAKDDWPRDEWGDCARCGGMVFIKVLGRFVCMLCERVGLDAPEES